VSARVGYQYLGLLMALNITFLLVSDFTGARIISIAGVGVSVTVLYFPFTYLIGDILTEVYGYAEARRIIWISIGCSIVGSLVAGSQLLVRPAVFFRDDPAYQTIFSLSPTIAIAGVLAYFAGDISTSYVMAKMKIWDQGRRLWLRFVSSTVVGEGVNTALFYGIALHGVLPARALARGTGMGWAVKVIVEVVMLPITYAVVRYLKRAEGTDHYDYGTDFNPFVLR
jgi:uncharacterized integral membrane protein (TIGR00697 family)